MTILVSFFESEFQSFLQDNLDNDTNTEDEVIWNYDFVFFLNPKIESFTIVLWNEIFGI